MILRRIILWVFLLSLFATVTNFVPLSVAFAGLAILLPVLSARWLEEPLPKFHFFLLLLYAYFLISTLLYSPGVLAQYAFYRRDGNFFITYLPILILGLVPLRMRPGKWLRRFVIWASLFSLGAYLWLPVQSDGLHHLAFIAHNAAGGFLSIVLALCLGLYWGRRQKVFLLLALLDFYLLYETGSRGSLLALAVAFVQILILKGRFNKLFLAGAVVSMIALLSFTYPLWLEAGKPDNGFESLGEINLPIMRSATIINRGEYLWPRALDNFLKSPLFGQGFGSYDDTPYRFEPAGLVTLIVSENFRHSDAHAHHSFLHILAETGLVGLLLFMMYLYSLNRFIETLPGALGLGLQLAFWVVIWSSFTEHRLTTPAQMLPFNILVGLCLAHIRGAVVKAKVPPENRALPAPCFH